MHPVLQRNFGNTTGKIKVHYHNGTTTVAGSIIKQMGTNKFKVTDGSTTLICALAQTTGAATTLTPGYMTILIVNYNGGGTEHIRRLSGNVAVTTEGHSLTWSLTVAANANGDGDIELI
jgi:hypothetical protein